MFDWIYYLDLADSLVSQDNESALRSAVSRAYYAAYNKALQKLIDEGQISRQDPTESSKHLAIWKLYRDSSDSRRNQAGNDGDRLRKSRVNADYVADNEFVQRDASMKVRNARDLYRRLDRL